MPSITGIWMSVSSRSNAPRSRVRISSASAPSSAVTVTWPSIAIARETSWRMESSSSAIRTRGIGSSPLARVACGLGLAAGEVALVEEADVDSTSLRRGRGEARLEPGALAGLERALLQHRVPGIDLRALGVAYREAQPRDSDRLLALADDHTLDDQHRFRVHRLIGDLDVLEGEAPQVHLQPDHPVERRGLRQQPNDVAAPEDQRQHQRGHGAAGGSEARAAQH